MTRLLALARRWRLLRDAARIALAMDPGDRWGSLTAGGMAADGTPVTWTVAGGRPEMACRGVPTPGREAP